jgi:hypothetical protein
MSVGVSCNCVIPEPLKDRQAVHTSSSQGYAGQGPRPAFEKASCPAANTRSSRGIVSGSSTGRAGSIGSAARSELVQAPNAVPNDPGGPDDSGVGRRVAS